jgi:hypothetical protein
LHIEIGASKILRGTRHGDVMKKGLQGLGLLVVSFISMSVVAHEHLKVKSWTPTSELVGKVEAELTMPAGATLSSYARYYYGQISRGHRMLIGEFVLSSVAPGVHIVAPAKVPKILDGGCSLIDLKYDVEKKVVVDLSCNGAG